MLVLPQDFLLFHGKKSKIFNIFMPHLNSVQIMKKLFFGALMLSVLMTSCVSNKKYADLEAQYSQTQQDLVDAKADLQKCLVDKTYLEELNASLKEDKARSLQQVENLTVLTQSSSDNIKEVIQKRFHQFGPCLPAEKRPGCRNSRRRHPDRRGENSRLHLYRG